MSDDLRAMLEECGTVRKIDGQDVLCIFTDEGEGADHDRVGVSVRVARLAAMASDMPRPRVGRRLDVDGVPWAVSRVQEPDGLLTVQIFREAS